MLELIFVIFVAIIAYNLGVSVTAWRLRDIIYKEAKAKGLLSEEEEKLFKADISEQEKNLIHKLRIDKTQDILYLYDYDNNTFVCQANTIDDLAKFALEYKNIKYAAVVMDNKAFVFANGLVKKSL